ncbi:MAG: M48 family metalloprotease [Armatimonadetes bacterium]|nr:M48 family metalloprotease [Armatimonadota bacterium]
MRRWCGPILALVFFLSATLSASAALISTEQEIAIGRQAAREIESQYSLVRDLGMVERINRIGQRLAANSARPEIQYSFRILDEDEFNALALPGGFAYATRGLMEGLPDEELAFVLGHEMAHVEKRHSVRQIENAIGTQLGLLAIFAAVGQGEISEGSANLMQLVGMVLNNRYSQAHETEADRVGTQLMAQAGYDPVFAVSSLQTLQSRSQGGMPGILNTFLGTHPLASDRVADVAERAGRIPFVVQIPAPVVAALPSFQGGQRDAEWEAQILETLMAADSGLVSDPALMNQARQLAVRPQTGSQDGSPLRILTTVPGTATAATAETELLLHELGPLLRVQRNLKRFGLGVGVDDMGTRQVLVLVR